MNYSPISLEIAVVLLGLGLLLFDLWAPAELRPKLGYAGAFGLALVLLFSFTEFMDPGHPQVAFGGMFVQDGLALFFKRLFLAAGIVVLLLGVEHADRIRTGITEYYSLSLFALAGMMCAASANDFSLLFVSLELITVTFYVLVSYQRNRLLSLEAGVKYLILGALSSAFLVFGIALVVGTSGRMNFNAIAAEGPRLLGDPLFSVGLLLVMAGLGFKIAAVPMQMWAPDVYQGAPTPTTAFLAIGSKAAGFALVLRVLFTAAPDAAAAWHRLWIGLAAATILYGNLAAIPQRNLKRLMGYSSIAHAGYILLGVAALTPEGESAVLFYLGSYLFAVLTVFGVISVAFRNLPSEDIDGLSGLHQRAPFLAAALALAMISLAGIPPLVGFFGKFMLIKAALAQGASDPAYYWLVGIALFGVVVSLYYYLGVVRAIYWGQPSTFSSNPSPTEPVTVSRPLQWALGGCVAASLILGIAPGLLLDASRAAIALMLP